jgi:hypothetical protein
MDRKEVVATWIGTAGAGAALMFFLDPDEGNRRRAFVRDTVFHLGKGSSDSFGKAARDLGNRTKGIVSEVKSRMMERSEADEVLAERVRSKIGRFVSCPRAIEVRARNGVVTLKGDVLRSEARRAMAEACMVRDVVDVRNDMKTHLDESGIPGFKREGGERRFGRRRQSPGVRLALGAAGGALTVAGTILRLRRHPTVGKALTSAGVGLLGSEIANTGFSLLVRRNGRA